MLNETRELLEKKIDFLDLNAKRDHLKESIRFFYAIKNSGMIKDDFVRNFNLIRQDVAFNIIPLLYNEGEPLLENAHYDFINDLTELVIDFGPPPKLWDTTEEDMLTFILTRYR